MVVRMAGELNLIRGERARDAATQKVDAAIREGRLVPSQREWAIAYCASDSAGFGKFIAAQPKIVEAGADGTFTGRIGDAPADALTRLDLMVCENLGVTAEKFAAAKKARLSHNVHLE
jgi:phage I-like protein